jgi:DNA polymerase-3 subunit epsilon
MADVTGATAMSLVPTGSGDVVEQLNAAAARRGWGLPMAIIAGLLGLLTMPYGLLI